MVGVIDGLTVVIFLETLYVGRRISNSTMIERHTFLCKSKTVAAFYMTEDDEYAGEVYAIKEERSDSVEKHLTISETAMRILVPRKQTTSELLEGAVLPICKETSIIYGEPD